MKTLVIVVAVAVSVVICFRPIWTGLCLLFCKNYGEHKHWIPISDSFFGYFGSYGHSRRNASRLGKDFELANYANFWHYLVLSENAKKSVKFSFIISGFFIWGYVLMLLNLATRKIYAAI